MSSLHPLRVGVAAFLVAALFGACTGTYLYDERRENQVPRDRTQIGRAHV